MELLTGSKGEQREGRSDVVLSYLRFSKKGTDITGKKMESGKEVFRTSRAQSKPKRKVEPLAVQLTLKEED